MLCIFFRGEVLNFREGIQKICPHLENWHFESKCYGGLDGRWCSFFMSREKFLRFQRLSFRGTFGGKLLTNIQYHTNIWLWHTVTQKRLWLKNTKTLEQTESWKRGMVWCVSLWLQVLSQLQPPRERHEKSTWDNWNDLVIQCAAKLRDTVSTTPNRCRISSHNRITLEQVSQVIPHHLRPCLCGVRIGNLVENGLCLIHGLGRAWNQWGNLRYLVLDTFKETWWIKMCWC